MVAHRTSIIWQVTKEELEKIVKESSTISQVLSYFKLENKGNNFRTLKKRLREDDISFIHISSKSIENRNKGLHKDPIPLKDILVENSNYNRTNLKNRLIKGNYLKLVCSICELQPIWNGIKLSLQLDHINGVSNDNRIENLRLLCPNCHSQTDSFAGKKNRKIKPPKDLSCRGKLRFFSRKVERLSKEELIELIKNNSYVKIGKMFGVSDNAIRKWSKSYHILI